MSTEGTALHVGVSRRHSEGAFRDWRTRPIAERQPPAERRRCQSCNCLLSSGNESDTCSPCSFGEIAVPGWAAFLIGSDPSPASCNTVAQALGVAPKPLRCRPQDMIERDAEMLRLHQEEGVSQYKLASRFGITRSSVECALRRARRYEASGA